MNIANCMKVSVLRQRQFGGENRNRDIAERLFIREETVKVHIKYIMEKLGAPDRAQEESTNGCGSVAAGLKLSRDRLLGSDSHLFPTFGSETQRSPTYTPNSTEVNFERVRQLQAAKIRNAIPKGRSLGFAQAIARPLPRSSPCVRHSQRPDPDQSCRG